MPRSFRESLTSGHQAEKVWVEKNRLLGLSVAHGKKVVLTKHNKVKDHCGNPDAALLMTVEIKERNLTFTGPDDFPYDTVFVDDLRGLGKETLRPFAYIFVSKATGRWVWVTPLDKDDTWTETVVTDTTRGHKMGMLVAPKSHLRSAEELQNYLVPHGQLNVIDGDTSLFVSGGGQIERRERYVEKEDPFPAGGDRKTAPKTRKHLG
jgi:hypothetical protein